MEEEYTRRWHISMGVLLTIVLFLAGWTFAGIWWAAKMDTRMGIMEQQNAGQEIRLGKLEDLGAKFAVIEDRQKRVLERLDIQTKTMQEILAIVGNRKGP